MQALYHSSTSNDDGLLTTGLLAGTKPNKVRGDRHELKRLAGVAPTLCATVVRGVVAVHAPRRQTWAGQDHRRVSHDTTSPWSHPRTGVAGPPEKASAGDRLSERNKTWEDAGLSS